LSKIYFGEMTSTLSREEADKISGDFEKICSREEKVATKSNVKIVLIVVTVVIVILLILIYLYFKGSLPTGPLINKLMRSNAEVGNSDVLSTTNQGPQMPQPLFGGEQVLLSNRAEL
jgi:hypothetical protein